MSITFNQNPFFTPAEKDLERTVDIPKKTGDIEKIHIKDKLAEYGFTPGENLSLGTFDQIGELTARKTRHPSSELYHSAGFFFKPNYERGLLIYAMVKHFKVENFLEVGFGRGYGTLCAAMAMHENGFGNIHTVDPNFDQNHLKNLYNAYPDEWFSRIQPIQGKSQDFLKSPDAKDTYDLIFLDGDHRYEAVKEDWDLCKDKMGHAIIFDDYSLPGKDDKDIEVSNVVDHIHGYNKQLIIADRRIFMDDRNLSDEEILAGMAIVTKAE